MNSNTHTSTTNTTTTSTDSTTPTTFYAHYVSGDVQSLEEWQAEDYTREWLETQEELKDTLCAIRPGYEWIDQPTPSPAEIIQDYIDLGYLIEVRRTETQAEKDAYGDWMAADK